MEHYNVPKRGQIIVIKSVFGSWGHYRLLGCMYEKGVDFVGVVSAVPKDRKEKRDWVITSHIYLSLLLMTHLCEREICILHMMFESILTLHQGKHT